MVESTHARTHNNNDVSSEGIDDDIDIAYASFSRLGFLRMKFFLGGLKNVLDIFKTRVHF